MNSIQDAARSVIPPRHKNAAKGWISFNAPCCTHNGETQDKRSRGGMMFGTDGSIVYHCFNCGFKTGWKPGLHFGLKMRKLMSWMGMEQAQVQRLSLEALRDVDQSVVERERIKEEIKFEPRELPANVSLKQAIVEQHEDAIAVGNYIIDRGFDLDDYDWRWSAEEGYNRRIIIPYTWQNEIVGYTARSIDLQTGRGKYIQHVGSDFVFNIDKQHRDSKFALVMEGTFDAIPLNGLAVLTNEVSERKAEIIDTLAREIIAVPDRDKSGGSLIDAAVEYGWSVAFPDWEADVKDCADACLRYGRLYTLQSILATKQTSRLKIELLRKRNGI